MSANPTPLAPSAGETPRILTRSPAVSRRLAADAVARWIVSAGGVATIASIAAILVFIGIEVVPLWSRARIDLASQFTVDPALRLPVVDEQRGVVAALGAAGDVDVYNLGDGKRTASVPVAGLNGEGVVAASRAGKSEMMLATASGRVVGVRVLFEGGRARRAAEADQESAASVLPTVALKPLGEWTLGEAPRLIASSRPGEKGVVIVYAAAGGPAQAFASIEKRNVFGAVQKRDVHQALGDAADATAFAVNADGTRAYVGTASGQLQFWDVSDVENPHLIAAAVAAKAPVTALTYLLGDTSLVVGDGSGGVNVWFPVRDATQPSGWRLQLVHPFPAHHAAVTAVAASPRDRSFLTADASGAVVLRHATTERDLATAPPLGAEVRSLAYAPKANGAVAMTAAGALQSWTVFNPHPEVTLQSLFGKVWYDGYEAPAYVWQSTGGTDEFEPKLSLRPLIFGTIKGTFYALLFAVPLAVLSALYTSQFAHPRVRSIVKPIVEVMAALPSVVLGFLAGLWLAPAIEGHVPAVLAMLLLAPTSIVLVAFLWRSLPRGVRLRLPAGLEGGILVPVVIAVAALCWSCNGWIERAFFGNNFHAWLLSAAGLRFDQRNCLIVGFAMGFAVIPIIFTISEDALANVPRRLVSASLALGATAWQTAIHVVLPTASPGIFSAIMIGFGRAVGETMIVLMATGNTPILDWNIFTGMRTLSANIAVEVSEAAHGGTLYRVLFLTALLLFIATFLLNTAAEVVRQRLRRRYQEL